jgi:hypothetical protein
MIGLTGVWIAIAAATCVPIGMFAYRMAVAADMMHAPRIVAGSASADCSLAMSLKSSDRPDYVQIADAWEWTIQPWSVDRSAPMHRINTTNGAALPLCELRHGTTTRGWAEWVASEAFTKEQCWEAFAPTNQQAICVRAALPAPVGNGGLPRYRTACRAAAAERANAPDGLGHRTQPRRVARGGR